jgi:hypothetical protein|tara:strand:+ start:4845 stop:5201 length:357 start_codon:yes stop_codon:yes gene_type:complete
MELLKQLRNKPSMTESSPDKFINGIAHLTALNKKAIRKKYNRQLDMKEIERSMHKNKKFSQVQDVTLTRMPVTFSMIHNDTEVRVQFMFNGAGDKAQLDMSFDDYAELPAISGITDSK